MATTPPKKARRSSQITWDEPTIAEHDKERGTRMVIDEPDTPFASYTIEGEDDDVNEGRFSLVDNMSSDGKADDDVSVDVDEKRLSRNISEGDQEKGGEHGSHECKSPTLEDAKNKGLLFEGVRGGLELGAKLEKLAKDKINGDEKDEEDEAKTPGKQSFAEKRSKHYNEAEMMKRWREQQHDDDDEEDEDDE